MADNKINSQDKSKSTRVWINDDNQKIKALNNPALNQIDNRRKPPENPTSNKK